ncbi:MAG: type II toxin-antitoxin system HicA family toxin [Candidatus Limnocylindrales bacterium]
MPVSSDQVIRAIEREGFSQSKGTGKRGSHRTWYRKRPGATSQTVTIILGVRELPEGTLRSMARQLGIDLDEFKGWIDRK